MRRVQEGERQLCRSASDSDVHPTMTSPRARTDRLRKALSFIAAFSLGVQALLLGLGIVSAGAARTAMLPAALVQFDCPDHEGGSEPADHQEGAHHRGFCCILCSKFGTILGPVPTSLPDLTPTCAFSTIRFAHGQSALGGTSSVFPVGARAPPHLG